MIRSPVLEVIACNVEDAIEAERGGASRLEVVRNLQLGGLTPPIELVARIKEIVDLPLRVMLRESLSYEINDEEEVGRLCQAAARFADLEVDGLVLGFLKRGRVDTEQTERVLQCAPEMKATFHHAFEETNHQLEALAQLKDLPQIDRVLSSGGSSGLSKRIERLNNYEQAAAPQLLILAGGGVDLDGITRIKRETNIREFHVGRAARLDARVDGPVSAELVEKLVQAVTQN